MLGKRDNQPQSLFQSVQKLISQQVNGEKYQTQVSIRDRRQSPGRMNRSELDELSLVHLRAQLVTSVPSMIGGFIVAIGNGILFAVILKTKQLRTNFYLCLMHIAIADGCLCFFMAITATKRIILVSLNQPETRAPIECFFEFFPNMLFKNAAPAQALTVAIDRLLCLGLPLQYAKVSIKKLQLINVVLWVIPICITCVAASYVNPEPLISNCIAGIVWLPIMNDASSWLGITLDSITILCYSGVLMVLIYRLRKRKATGNRFHMYFPAED